MGCDDSNESHSLFLFDKVNCPAVENPPRIGNAREAKPHRTHFERIAMFSRLYTYLTYREPFVYYIGMQRIESKYYSIGACLLVVALIVAIGISIAFTVTTCFYTPTH